MTLHFTTSQVAYRGYDDDAGLGAATPKAAQNTGWVQAVDTNFRVRFELQETAGVSGSFVPQLQYNLNAAGFVNVTGSSTVVRSFASPNVADGAATADLLTVGTGTFAAGAFDEVDGLTGTHTVAASGHTEVEFCVQIRSADVGSGDSIQLRVIGKSTATTALDTYAATPTVTTPTNPLLTLDLDANALTGLVDTDPIPTFTDQSGQANSVTQATGTAQAAYRTNQTPSGKPVARFDGGDFYTKGSAPAGMATQEFTWFAVVNSSLFGDNRIIMVAGASTGGREWRLYTDGKQGLIKCNTADLLIGTATRTTGTWYIVAVRYKTDGTINLYKSDGTSDGTTTTVANFVDTSADLWVGEHTGGGGKWTGDIAEIKAYNYARTDVQVTDEITALDTKWLSAATGDKTLSDSGAGSDALVVDSPSKFPSDSGVAVDSLVVDKPTVYEIGSAVPGIALPGLAPAGSVPAAGAAPTAKTLNDAAAAAQSLTVAAQVGLADAATASDSLVVTAQVPLADSGAAAESVQVGIPKSLSDQGTSADQVQVAAQVTLADQGTAADSVQVGVPKTLTDSAAAADQLTVPVPQQVANCHLWLRPEGIAALANGAGIATWPDESGFVNDPIQATGTAQPTKADNAINNLPAALFDPAASQRLRSTTADVLTAFNNVPGATMFAVSAPNLEDSTDRQIIYWSTNSVGSRRAGLVKSNPSPGNMAMSGRRLDTDAAGTVFETTAATSGVWALHCGVLDYANASASIYRNSILEGGPTGFQTAGNTSATNSVAVGIGSSSAAVGGGFWPGYIAEIIVYNRVLTSTERDLVTNYLIGKYNLTVETPKTLPDTAAAADQVQVTVAAPLAETGTAVDALSVAQGVTPKTLADSGAAADQVQVAAVNGQADSGAGVDLIQPAAAVPFAETAAAADSLTVGQFAPKSLPDSGTAADQVQVTAQATLPDSGTTTDQVQIAAQANLLDSAAAADSLTVGQFQPKTVTDSGQAADLFQAAAAVPLAEQGTTQDLLQPAATLPLSDSGSAADSLAVAQGIPKTLSDTGAASDQSTVTAQVPLGDSGQATDSVAADQTRTLTDSAAAADQLQVGQFAPKTLADSAAAADQVLVATTIPLGDQAAGAETLLPVAAVSLPENAGGADSLTAAGIGDQKTLTDGAAAADSLTVVQAKLLTDSSTGSDQLTVLVDRTLTDQGVAADSLRPTALAVLAETATAADVVALAALSALRDSGAAVDTMVVLTVAYWIRTSSREPATTSESREPALAGSSREKGTL